MTESDCIFCKIAAGKIPVEPVYEDDEIVAFRDIAPQAPVHVILIPRIHLEGLNALLAEQASLVGRLALVAQGLAQKLGVAQSGWRLLSNCGADAGQTVPHLHFHLLGGRALGGKLVE